MQRAPRRLLRLQRLRCRSPRLVLRAALGVVLGLERRKLLAQQGRLVLCLKPRHPLDRTLVLGSVNCVEQARFGRLHLLELRAPGLGIRSPSVLGCAQAAVQGSRLAHGLVQQLQRVLPFFPGLCALLPQRPHLVGGSSACAQGFASLPRQLLVQPKHLILQDGIVVLGVLQLLLQTVQLPAVDLDALARPSAATATYGAAWSAAPTPHVRTATACAAGGRVLAVATVAGGKLIERCFAPLVAILAPRGRKPAIVAARPGGRHVAERLHHATTGTQESGQGADSADSTCGRAGARVWVSVRALSSP